MKMCVVVFPLYKTPNALELAFLENGLEKLQGFDAVIACPQNLKIDAAFGKLEELKTVRFDEHFFDGIAGYNQLMLSTEFYAAFDDYQYLLIHQADVYIFKNELSAWCAKGYAYIGAPWYRPTDKLLKRIFNIVRKTFSSNYGIKHNKVGNGGFSLRNVQQAKEVLGIVPNTLLEKYLGGTHHLYNEDVFWSLEAPGLLRSFNIPKCDEALHFGIEFNPEPAMRLLKGSLPFGCHAPEVHKPSFWKKYIPELK